MRRNRIILAALWILSLVGISFYGGPVSYGFFTVLTLLPLVSLLYLVIVLFRFKIYQTFEGKELVAGHMVPFFFTLQNEDPFTFSGVRVTFYADFSEIDGLSDKTEYELLPRTSITRQTGLICRYRGEYHVGIKAVILTDYLRLFRITYQNREPLRVTVLPDLVTPEALRSIDAETLSRREATGAGACPDVTVRDYLPGDDIRRIHWKLAAKTGELSVRNSVSEEKDGVIILLDTLRISEAPSVYLPVENTLLESALALALFLRNKNIPSSVSYSHGGLHTCAVSHDQPFDGLYRELSGIRFETDALQSAFLTALTADGTLFSARIALILTAKATEEILTFSRLLGDGGTEVVLYRVMPGEEDAPPVSISPHVTLLTLPGGCRVTDYL
ncbi:MAG: DUF58 domain-containing protein [Lachnospiraceae bacterium]|nr:DUF58 domain-containing protein [Lachnospiraceae bacterium]